MARLLAELTYEEVAEVLATGPVVALVPVGSVEPHGPHLPLETDTAISVTCARRAADRLEAETTTEPATPPVRAVVAPSVPYGVTDYASGFAGAVGVPAAALTAMLHAIAKSLLATGFAHVCFVNNHLEPAHDAAVRAAIEGLPEGAASVACPLTRRWGRTLSDEFKRGACHAGRYETSLALASGAHVRESFGELPSLGLSLSEAIRSGKSTFAEIGMERAYTGAPRDATAEEGEELYEKLVTMVVTEVSEALLVLRS